MYAKVNYPKVYPPFKGKVVAETETTVTVFCHLPREVPRSTVKFVKK